MQIEIEDNPNCQGTDQLVFSELDKPRIVRAIRILEGAREIECDVVGVERDGFFTPAKAVKIADSGAGYAFLIYGSGWGIRLRLSSQAGEPWDFANPRQWGEPFKIYGEEDILYA